MELDEVSEKVEMLVDFLDEVNKKVELLADYLGVEFEYHFCELARLREKKNEKIDN